MDFSSHRLQCGCSKSKPLGLNTSSKSTLENGNGAENLSATISPVKDEILDNESNLDDKVENTSIIFSSPCNKPSSSANIDSSTLSAVSEPSYSTKVTKSEEQIYERILEKLYTAYYNLSPAIDEIISSATEFTAADTLTLDCSECSVTQEQYIGAIEASRLIQEVHNDVVQSAHFNLNLIKENTINLPSADFIVNSVQPSIYTKLEDTFCGPSVPRIYIQKNVVEQLIELYNLLHGALQQLSQIAEDKHIPVNQTNTILSKNCGRVKLLHTSKNQHTLSNSSSTDNPENSKLLTKLQEEYQGLSDAVDMLKSIIKETSGSVGDIIKVGKNLQDARKSKSDNSMAEIEKSKKITDVSGARRCILECLVELAEVRKYLKNLDSSKETNVISQICLTADLKRECCSKQNIPHLHAKLNGVPIVVKLNQETFDTILSSVGSYPPYNINEDSHTGIIGSYQKHKCIASKSSPIIKSSGQSTKLISSDEKELSSKPKQEYGCKQKCSISPELNQKEIIFRLENKQQKDLIKPKIQLKNSQSFTQINEKAIQLLNQSCKSLDSFLNNQQSIRKRSHSSPYNQMKVKKRQTLNQSVDQGDFLAAELSKLTSFGGQETREVRGKPFKKLKTDVAATIPEYSKKKSKQLARTSKSKIIGLVRSNNSEKLLKTGCYTKRKLYKYCTENNFESALQQVGPINKDIINNANEKNYISTTNKRMNKLYGTYSTENINASCYENDYRLFTDKNEQRIHTIPSLNFIVNNVVEEHNNFNKLVSTKAKQEINKASGSFCTNSVNMASGESDSSLVFATAENQHKNRKLSHDFPEGHANNAHKVNYILNKQFTSDIQREDNMKIPNNFQKKIANNEENCNLTNSFIDKVKQQIIKLADRISPKNTDSIPEQITNLNILIIDEIKQQDIFKLFNTSLVKSSGKLHKQRDNCTKLTNPLTSKERELNKLERKFFMKNINNSLERNSKLNKSCTSKNKERTINLSSNKLNEVPGERTILAKSRIKQEETIKYFDDLLVGNSGNENNFNKNLIFATKQQKTLKLSNSAMKGVTDMQFVKNDMRCDSENSLLLNKALQCKTLSAVKSRNMRDVNRLTVNLKRKPNYKLNTTSKFQKISELTLKKDAQSRYESMTKFLLHEKDNKESVIFKSDSTLNVPYVVSIKSIPKMKIEKARPNSKFTTKNTLLQNDGIYHPNKRIKRQLEELGFQNIFRASSLAKCCKKGVVHEKPQVGIPYEVSLTSLPLDDTDTINVISKQNIKRQHDELHNTCYSKLNYYSNLETSFKRTPKNTYEVRYFELKSNMQSEDKSVPPANKTIKKNQTSEKKDENVSPQHTHPFDNQSENASTNSTSEYSNYIPPWGQSFEVRVFEYARKGSDTDMPMAMSNRRDTTMSTGTNTLGAHTLKSKYYSYPDEEDYIRHAQRPSIPDERRPGERFPRMVNRRPVERRTGTAPHYHGESHLALEPWAPFSISDTSLPGTSNTRSNKANNPPNQGGATFPETASLRSTNYPVQKSSRYKEAETPNQYRGGPPVLKSGSERTNRDAGVDPIILTPELLRIIKKGVEMEHRNADMSPIIRNINFTRGVDDYGFSGHGVSPSDDYGFHVHGVSPFQNNMLPINKSNIKCCHKMCTVSTDTDDIDFEVPRKCSQVTVRASKIPCQQKRSSCLQYGIAYPSSQKANKNEITKKPSQKSCSKQSLHKNICRPAEPSTSKNHPKYQTKQNTGNTDTHKCEVSKDLCLCDYASKRKQSCGSKTHTEKEVKNQQLDSCVHHSNTDNHENNKCNKASHSQDKTPKTITDPKAEQPRKAPDCFKCYNHNPHVMYYLGEQRNNISKMQTNSSDNYQLSAEENHKSDIPSKLSRSLDQLMSKSVCMSADADTIQNPKRRLTTAENNKTPKSITHQENIVQYCLESQSNTMKLPFCHKPTIDLHTNKITDVKYEHPKIQIDKYYLLCLPNEASSSNENTVSETSNATCLPHTELNTPNNNSPEYKHKKFNKQKGNHGQYENISIMLKSHLNSNNDNSRGQLKRSSEPSKSVDEVSSGKCNDSTIYVFQGEPKLDNNNKSSINQQTQPSLSGYTDVSLEAEAPINEKIIFNDNQTSPAKEPRTDNLRDRKCESQSGKYRHEMVNKKDDEHYLCKQKENQFEGISKESKMLKDDYKYKISSTGDSHRQSTTTESSKPHQNVTNQKSAQERKILKPIQYRSIAINTDSAIESETASLNESYSDVCNPIDYTELSSMNSNNPSETWSIPVMKQFLLEKNYNTSEDRNTLFVSEAFPEGRTQQSSMLLKQFGTAIANIASEVATNKSTEENKIVNKRSAETESHQNLSNTKEDSGMSYLVKNLIYGCLPQNVTGTSGSHTPYASSNTSVKGNPKEISVSGHTSKYSIIISQLTDASTCTQNVSISSSTQCLKDVTNTDTGFICKRKHSGKHSADVNIVRDHCYYDREQAVYSNKSTQSPPVIYRSKLSDFIKKSIPGYEIPKNLPNFKLERPIDNYCNLVNRKPNTSKKSQHGFEHGNFTKTEIKRVSRSLQTDDDTVSNSKIQEYASRTERSNLVNQQSSNVIKNAQKRTKKVSHLINNNNNDKSNATSVHYVENSQQTENFTGNRVTSNKQLSTNVEEKQNSCSASKKQILRNKSEKSNKNQTISDPLKTSRQSSSSAINKSTVGLDSSSSKTYTEAYKSRLFSCNSWLNLPIQLENKKCSFRPNSFWIPPDYNESEFNVYTSDSRLSNCLSSKDNNYRNMSGKSSQISDENEVESTCRTEKDNTCADNSSNRNSSNHLKDNRTYSFAALREAYHRAPSPPRIVPVALAMSQQECQEVSSGPIIPVVLAISQQEYQKVSPSAPILSSNEPHPSLDFLFHQTNVCENQSTINYNKCPTIVFQEKSLNTQQESIAKQVKGEREASDQCKISNYDEQLDKNQDKVYWALTRVKTHRDGSQDYEILETTPIPPGHFLIPTTNNVVLVGNQPCISDENKEVNRKQKSLATGLNNRRLWSKPLSKVFMRMLRRCQRIFEDGVILNYWNKKDNLIKYLSESTLDNIANNFLRIINDIERNPNHIYRHLYGKNNKSYYQC